MRTVKKKIRKTEAERRDDKVLSGFEKGGSSLREVLAGISGKRFVGSEVVLAPLSLENAVVS